MTLGLAIASFIFAFLAFLVSAGTLTYLLARRFSTVEVVQEAPGETQHYFPVPPAWARDPGSDPNDPSPPVTLSESEYQRRLKTTQMEREYEEEAAELEI